MNQNAKLRNVEEILPLSPTQEGILFESLADPAARGRYRSVIRVVLGGALEPDRFREIFSQEALKPDVARACFVHDGMARPLQIIREKVEMQFEHHDWSGAADVAAGLDDLERRLRAATTNLAEAPLMAAHLVRLAPDRHALLWAVHHLISDAWSAHVVLDTVLARLAGADPPPPGPPFRDHLARLQARDRAADRAHFRRALHGVAGATLLAAEGAPGRSLFERTTSALDPADAARLDATARRLRVTRATALVTAWALCLRRFTGRDDVMFGRVTSGRDPSAPGIDRAVGPYLAVSPARFSLGGSVRLRDVLARAEADFNEARRFEGAALNDALAGANAGPRLPFDTLVSIQGFAPPAHRGSLTVLDARSRDATGFPLALIIRPGAGVEVEVVHDPHRVPTPMARDIADAYTRLLAGMAATPDALIRDLPGLPPTAAVAMGAAPFVHLEIRARALERPDDIAVAAGVARLAYGELHRRAAALARRLRDAGVGRGDIVPIVAERTERTVIGVLATLYAGAGYSPIDPAYPEQRARDAMALLTPKLAIGDAAPPGWEGPLLSAGAAAGADADDFAPVAVEARDTAYVLFTSGSTGEPKGVVVSHRNLAWSTAARAPVYGSPPRGFLHLSSFAFDSSVVGLYWTLATGGALILAAPRAEQDVAGLVRLVATSGATHLLALPRIWEAMLEKGAPPACLETVIVAGEAVGAGLTERHRAAAPKVRLFNEYGPTEATVWCAAAEIGAETRSAPIGWAPPGAAVDVCDRDGARLPRGMIGEIVVRGAGVAQGYLGASANAGGFVARPEPAYRTGDLGSVRADGALCFHGRLDAQVKILGRRVELGDIEAAARRCGAVEAAASVQDERIILAVSGAPADLAERLAAYLPQALRPAAVHRLQALPTLPNGKVDRRAVAALGLPAPRSGPATEGFFEGVLSELWSAALGVECGPDTHFFEAGGDSLQTIRVLAAAEARGLVLRPGDMFDHPVLGDLAGALRARARRALPIDQENMISSVNVDGAETPFFMLHGSPQINAALAASLGPDRPFYFLWSHHLGGRVEVTDRVESLAVGILRSVLAHRPEGPCVLGGFSFGGTLAQETARLLEAAGRPVRALILVDPAFDLAPPAGVPEPPLDRIGRLARVAVRMLRAAATRRTDQRRVARVSQIYRMLAPLHRPRLHSGPAVLMQGPLGRRNGRILAAVLPEARRVALPYGHMSLVHDDEAIADTAARIAAELRAIERETRS